MLIVLPKLEFSGYITCTYGLKPANGVSEGILMDLMDLSSCSGAFESRDLAKADMKRYKVSVSK